MRSSDYAALDGLRLKHKGQPGFILGSGTSLLALPPADFAKLADRVTFGANFLAKWDGLTFQPTYYCATEEDWFGPISDLAAERCPDSVKVFAKNHAPHAFPRYAEWTYAYRDHGATVSQGYIVDPAVPFEQTAFASCGGSVVGDCALQLAVWTGCNPIYFLGVDCDSRGHVWDTTRPNRWVSPRHPSRLSVELGQAARLLIYEDGTRLINATPGGQLDSLVRLPLAEALNEALSAK